MGNKVPVRWGILGFGTFSDAAMAPAINRTAGHRLVAVWGRTRERVESLVDRYAVSRRYRAVEELLHLGGLDAFALLPRGDGCQGHIEVRHRRPLSAPRASELG
jgi:predicted dehydrogenase